MEFVVEPGQYIIYVGGNSIAGGNIYPLCKDVCVDV